MVMLSISVTIFYNNITSLVGVMCAYEFVCVCMLACTLCMCMPAYYAVHVYGCSVLQLRLSCCLSLLMLAIEYLSRPI